MICLFWVGFQVLFRKEHLEFAYESQSSLSIVLLEASACTQEGYVFSLKVVRIGGREVCVCVFGVSVQVHRQRSLPTARNNGFSIAADFYSKH